MAFENFKKPEDKAKTDTKNWYSDRYQTAIVQRNILFVASMVALLGLFATIFLIYTKIPLVTVEPFAIEIDRRAGIVQAVAPLDGRQFEKDQAVSNYFLVQYLRARETVNIGDFAFSANLVRLMSDPTIFKQYLKSSSPLDPKTPAGRIGQQGRRDVIIQSINPISSGSVQLRFLVQETNSINEVRATEHYLANIHFEFRKIDLSLDEAFLNPVGFYVTEYSLIKESQ